VDEGGNESIFEGRCGGRSPRAEAQADSATPCVPDDTSPDDLRPAELSPEEKNAIATGAGGSGAAIHLGLGAGE
jgi:hypothetical protein